MNRRLRLALFLAALAAAGPMPSVRAADARLDVSVAWFSGEQTVSPKLQQSQAIIRSVVVARTGFHPHAAPALSSALLPHSLFQRPPPFQD